MDREKKRRNKTDNNLEPHGITELIQMWPKNVDQVDRMVLEHFPQGSVNCDLIHLQHCDWRVLARACACACRVAYHVAWRISPTLSWNVLVKLLIMPTMNVELFSKRLRRLPSSTELVKLPHIFS